ncbi:MAG: AI-2E family transporter [Bacilli bacterium]
MLKNKLDYKLVNLTLIALIIAIIYFTSNFWLMIYYKIIRILIPLFIAFAIAHALYPLLRKLEQKGIPKPLAFSLIIFAFFGLILFVFYIIFPLLYTQIISLLNSLLSFINHLSNVYNLNLGVLHNSLNDTLNSLIKIMSEYVSYGAISFINKSFILFTSILVIIFVSAYLLIDMDKIRGKIKEHLEKRNPKTFAYLKILDQEMRFYLIGLTKLLTWQFFEYNLVYYAIGHPHFLLIAFLASITTFIPYLGAIATNIIALITALVVSVDLFFLTLGAVFTLTLIDSYIISPKIFGTTNKIPPLLVILAVFIMGVIAGVFGIIIAIPITIIILSAFKYYKSDLYAKFDKEKK